MISVYLLLDSPAGRLVTDGYGLFLMVSPNQVRISAIPTAFLLRNKNARLCFGKNPYTKPGKRVLLSRDKNYFTMIFVTLVPHFSI